MSDTAILERLGAIEKAIGQGDRPLNFEEAARYLSCSKSYLYKLTHRRLVPCYKPLGKRLFFRRGELEAFILQNPLKTKAQIEGAAIARVALGKAGAPC